MPAARGAAFPTDAVHLAERLPDSEGATLSAGVLKSTWAGLLHKRSRVLTDD